MVLLIDFTGILVIFALIYQGYVEGLQFRPSLMMASLCSVIVFALFFTGVYLLIMQFIPYSIISGLLTVIILNSFCIFLFYKLFTAIIALVQTKFFIPQFSDKNKKIGGMIIGTCVGYIFVAGMITSLEQAMVYKKHKHTNLVSSIFYKSSKESKNINISRKIDNLPALNMLYSQQNVEKFQFTEGELLAIMKIIREISNEEAKQVLAKINAKEDIKQIYLHIIQIYLLKSKISNKYFVPKEEIEALRLKIDNTQTITLKNKKTIDSAIDSAIKI